VGGAAGEAEERRDRDHVLVLGWLGPSPHLQGQEGQHHPAISLQVSRSAAQGESVHRAQGDYS